MLSVTIGSTTYRRPFSRLFASDAEYDKELFGFAAKPLGHAHDINLAFHLSYALRI